MKDLKDRFLLCICVIIVLISCGKGSSEPSLGTMMWMYFVVLGCNNRYYCDESRYKDYGGVKIDLKDLNKCAIFFSRTNRNIFRTDGTVVSENAVKGNIPLQCKIVNNSIIEDYIYSWYKADLSDSKRGILVFTHSLVKNQSGQIVNMDFYNNFVPGYSYYCCADQGDTEKQCFLNKINFAVCEKIQIQ